ncbi:putative jacalin-like lectin domain-containing protein [Plasmopara halstedii]
MVAILPTFVCALLAVFPHAYVADDAVQLSASFGGDFGTEFSDQSSATSGQKIESITIRAGKRVDGIVLVVKSPKEATFNHGGYGGKPNTLTLGNEEYIVSMEAHWDTYKGKKRIFFLAFSTNAGKSVSGGSHTQYNDTAKAPEGCQLGGFFGRAGDEVDKIGAIWTRISAEAPVISEPARAPEVDRGSDHLDASSNTGSEGDSEGGGSGSVLQLETDASRDNSTEDSRAASTAGFLDSSTGDFEITFPPGSVHESPDASNDDLPSLESLETYQFASDLQSLSGSTAGSWLLKDFEITFPPESVHESTEASDSASNEGSSSLESAEDSGHASAAESASSASVVQSDTPTIDVKDSIQQSELFGGPHGMNFTDKNLVNSGQKVSQISIYAGKRLDGVSIDIKSPKTLTFTHGGTGGKRQVLKLDDGEYINSMEVHWGKKDGHTRIFYVAFKTSAGKTLSGGSTTNDKRTVTAPEGFQLAGFYGSDGKEIDSLGAVWAYIDLVTPAPTPAPAPVTEEDSPGTVAPEDIASSLSEVDMVENNLPVQLSDSFGGPHGEQFSDQLACTSGMIIKSVTIRAGKRVDGLIVQVSAPKEMTFKNGGNGGKDNTITLEPGEYITKMEVNVGQRMGHTRIFFVSLTTSKSNTVSGGTPTVEKSFLVAPKGYQLSGFFGRYGDEMDLVGAVWTSIAKMNETINSPVSADEDVVLGELFGGPHGNAFSDIEKLRFSQTIASISIRSNKRLDFVQLKLSRPEDVIMKHGGRGGTEKSITLAPDEHITSMEVHWDRKDKHTRVFYVAFTTTAGQILSGGTKTKNVATSTAPEGFILGGFYGRAANEVDQIGAIWINKTAKDLELTDPTGMGQGMYGTTIRNWVGPSIGRPTDTSCYRKVTDYDSSTICPLGYGKQDFNCMARCPLSFPVTCGGECIPQNDDCALMVLDKIGSVLFVVLNAASLNLFGEIRTAYKLTKRVVMCAKHIVGAIHSLIYYLRYRQTTAPVGETAEMLAMAYQADVVIFDIPIAVCVCLGIDVPSSAGWSDIVLSIVEGIVKAVITQGDELIKHGINVLNLLQGNGLANDSSTTKDELEDLVKKNSTCGWELKRLTDRIIRAVLRYRNASDSLSDVRVKVYKSAIVLNDIPTVTNNCMGELLTTKTRMAAFQTRDLLRKTFGVIVDQLIDTGHTDNGTHVAEDEYRLEVANMGLTVLASFDPTGITYMAAQFVQPICGPTAYIGEIDDGTLYDALGLQVVDEAFRGTYGFYTHKGDGVVHLIFESVDTKDVTVVIHSGGDGYTKVNVGAGDVTTWDATFPEFEDKTLYLDRWRPGIFGLPGKGGGSLKMWIPRSSLGGHITMHVRINPS